MTSSAWTLAVPSCYERWYRHFLSNRGASRNLPWQHLERFSSAELRLVSESIQQFQLGEWARGRGLMRRAAAHTSVIADPYFLPALELFIAEEQEHSRILGRLLDREGVPRLKNHWIDGVFRRLRKLAGLEVCVATLVTAEALAMPFYQALRDATRSYLLRAICWRILCDEAAHLSFQALTLGLLRQPLSAKARRIRSLCHSTLFHSTALLLWQQHRRVFRAAGWSFSRFWNDARREFVRMQSRIRQISLDGGATDSLEAARLD